MVACRGPRAARCLVRPRARLCGTALCQCCFCWSHYCFWQCCVLHCIFCVRSRDELYFRSSLRTRFMCSMHAFGTADLPSISPKKLITLTLNHSGADPSMGGALRCVPGELSLLSLVAVAGGVFISARRAVLRRQAENRTHRRWESPRDSSRRVMAAACHGCQGSGQTNLFGFATEIAALALSAPAAPVRLDLFCARCKRAKALIVPLSLYGATSKRSTAANETEEVYHSNAIAPHSRHTTGTPSTICSAPLYALSSR